MSAPDLRGLSVELEREALFDSIPTIERVYSRDPEPDGPLLCCYSRENTYGQHDCRFRRHDPVAMWKHIHFGPHGKSFGQSWRAFLVAHGVGTTRKDGEA